ncbi:MAG: CDP-alcohol phosphatidyltransferase family protein [Methylococcaceae bacterium]
MDSTDETRTTLRAEFRKDWAVLPNLITEARLFLSPIAAIIYLINPDKYYLIAMIVFVVVATTDKIDGYLARRLDMCTLLGKALDPIVDKVLVGATLVSLSIVTPMVWVPTILIVTREISVFLMLKRVRQHGRVIATVYSGKVKMVVQCFAIAFLFMPFTGTWERVTWSLVGASVSLTMTSWMDYLRAYNKK